MYLPFVFFAPTTTVSSLTDKELPNEPREDDACPMYLKNDEGGGDSVDNSSSCNPMMHCIEKRRITIRNIIKLL